MLTNGSFIAEDSAQTVELLPFCLHLVALRGHFSFLAVQHLALSDRWYVWYMRVLPLLLLWLLSSSNSANRCVCYFISLLFVDRNKEQERKKKNMDHDPVGPILFFSFYFPPSVFSFLGLSSCADQTIEERSLSCTLHRTHAGKQKRESMFIFVPYGWARNHVRKKSKKKDAAFFFFFFLRVDRWIVHQMDHFIVHEQCKREGVCVYVCVYHRWRGGERWGGSSIDKRCGQWSNMAETEFVGVVRRWKVDYS